MINTILARSVKGAPVPEVGMGATVLMWSDRNAATIIGVTLYKSGPRKGTVRTVTVQRDIARRTDTRGMSDAQDWEFERDPNGAIGTFVFRPKTGAFERDGFVLAVGYRSEHFDFSF